MKNWYNINFSFWLRPFFKSSFELTFTLYIDVNIFFFFFRKSFHLWMSFAVDFRFAQSNQESWIKTIAWTDYLHIRAHTSGNQRQHFEWPTLPDPIWDRTTPLAIDGLWCAQRLKHAIQQYWGTAPSATTSIGDRKSWTIKFESESIAMRNRYRSNWITIATRISIWLWHRIKIFLIIGCSENDCNEFHCNGIVNDFSRDNPVVKK